MGKLRGEAAGSLRVGAAPREPADARGPLGAARGNGCSPLPPGTLGLCAEDQRLEVPVLPQAHPLPDLSQHAIPRRHGPEQQLGGNLLRQRGAAVPTRGPFEVGGRDERKRRPDLQRDVRQR
eukprot:3331454-Lingulodinium_polyedra.AAC.1